MGGTAIAGIALSEADAHFTAQVRHRLHNDIGGPLAGCLRLCGRRRQDIRAAGHRRICDHTRRYGSDTSDDGV
jgi:hypothetical protein